MSIQQHETSEDPGAVPAPGERKNRLWPLLIAAAILMAAGVIAVVISGSSTRQPAENLAAAATPSAPSSAIAGEHTMTGPALLRYLANHVGESPADHTTGIYTHIVIVEFARGSADIGRQRLESWHTRDGRLRVESYAALPPVPAAGFNPSIADPAPLLSAPATETHVSDIKQSDIALAEGANPLQELTVALQHGQPDWLTATASVRLDTITSLFRQQYLSPRLRAAALLLLADQGEFTHQRVTDRAGRSGIAFTLTDDGARWRLVVDPASGQLLAYERWTLQDGKLDTYALILIVERTDRTPSPASPTPASTIIPTAPPAQRAPVQIHPTDSIPK